ncbi:MAG: plasmid pRiA4b ORF-3 family protein [Pseudonocardia sp.]
MANLPTPVDTIISSARHCPAFTAARRLAAWVGEGRRVTPAHVLRPVDVPEAVRALGIPVPARVRRASDVRDLHHPWKLALAVGFLRIVDGHVRPGPALAQWPDADDDTVRELWLAGLATTFATTMPRADEAGAATFARAVLTVFAADPQPSFPDLSRAAREALTDEDPYAGFDFLTTWRRQADPVAAAAGPLVEFGAVDRHGPRVRITALGHWGLQAMQARAPKPITADLPAAELITRLAAVESDARWYAAQPWLVDRAPLPTARDLLHAAATAAPAQRVAAVELVHALGKEAEPAWADAQRWANLAAHARAIEWESPNAQDSAWLAVEYAAAALTVSGPDEALSCLDERVPGTGLDRLLRAVEGGTHPATTELTQALTAFLASGATPTSSRAYQLKISLNRMRPPIWRRVLMPATADLAELHQVIQVVMDWDGDHLHAFTVGQKHYGDTFFSPELDDEDRLRCSDAFTTATSITYRYDFGDCWDHTITCERVVDLDDGATYPVCIAGGGDSPVEDWIEGPDSTPFDQDTINRRLAGHQQ